MRGLTSPKRKLKRGWIVPEGSTDHPGCGVPPGLTIQERMDRIIFPLMRRVKQQILAEISVPDNGILPGDAVVALRLLAIEVGITHRPDGISFQELHLQSMRTQSTLLQAQWERLVGPTGIDKIVFETQTVTVNGKEGA